MDLTEHRPVVAVARPFVAPVDLSRLPDFQASVTQLPALMAGRSGGDRARVLIQFVKDWNYWTLDRAAMLDGEPPPGGDPFDLACIAAVVHALTARDSGVVPSWVHRYRSVPPRLFTGVAADSANGRLIVAEAPPVCAAHGVFFEAGMLERGRPARP